MIILHSDWLKYRVAGWVEDFVFYSKLLSALFTLGPIAAMNGLAFYLFFMVYSGNL